MCIKRQSQASLDARHLANMLVEHGDVRKALHAYEGERLTATAELVRLNRLGGPERVIDVVEERAPDGFSTIDDVASHEEREAIVKGYASLAGYEKAQVNTAV